MYSILKKRELSSSGVTTLMTNVSVGDCDFTKTEMLQHGKVIRRLYNASDSDNHHGGYADFNYANPTVYSPNKDTYDVAKEDYRRVYNDADDYLAGLDLLD